MSASGLLNAASVNHVQSRILSCATHHATSLQSMGPKFLAGIISALVK